MGGKTCTRLSAVAFGISLGILSALIMAILAWVSMHGAYGADVIKQWGSVYPGYEASIKGGFIGLAWGFLEGFIFGLIWAWLYNLCLCCCGCCPCCKRSEMECKS